jgi:hypothetical protein
LQAVQRVNGFPHLSEVVTLVPVEEPDDLVRRQERGQQAPGFDQADGVVGPL